MSENDNIVVETTGSSAAAPHDPCFDDPTYGDLQVIVNDAYKYHVHRFVLSMISPVFQQMLTNGMKESREAELRLQEEDPHAPYFGQLLSFFYPFSHVELTTRNVSAFLHFADKYDLPHKLKRECELFLLALPPSWELLCMAQKYGLKELLNEQAEWASGNVQERVHPNYEQLEAETCRCILRHVAARTTKLINAFSKRQISVREELNEHFPSESLSRRGFY
ncbi:hypothetical protein QOT17_004749 [Balamuthia mandrillaris]